jgi:hypothetical protein
MNPKTIKVISTLIVTLLTCYELYVWIPINKDYCNTPFHQYENSGCDVGFRFNPNCGALFGFVDQLSIICPKRSGLIRCPAYTVSYIGNQIFFNNSQPHIVIKSTDGFTKCYPAYLTSNYPAYCLLNNTKNCNSTSDLSLMNYLDDKTIIVSVVREVVVRGDVLINPDIIFDSYINADKLVSWFTKWSVIVTSLVASSLLFNLLQYIKYSLGQLFNLFADIILVVIQLMIYDGIEIDEVEFAKIVKSNFVENKFDSMLSKMMSYKTTNFMIIQTFVSVKIVISLIKVMCEFKQNILSKESEDIISNDKVNN